MCGERVLRGSASNAAGELIGGGRRLRRDGSPIHHHLGVSAFATCPSWTRLPVEKLISSTISLEDVNRGMDELAEGKAIRQVIEFPDSSR